MIRIQGGRFPLSSPPTSPHTHSGITQDTSSSPYKCSPVLPTSITVLLLSQTAGLQPGDGTRQDSHLHHTKGRKCGVILGSDWPLRDTLPSSQLSPPPPLIFPDPGVESIGSQGGAGPRRLRAPSLPGAGPSPLIPTLAARPASLLSSPLAYGRTDQDSLSGQAAQGFFPKAASPVVGRQR